MKEEQSDSPKLVRDLMTVGVVTCPLDAPISDLTQLMLEEELEGVIVLDERGHAAGVVTHDDLVKAYGRGQLDGLTAEKLMQPEVPQVPPDIPLTAAAEIMQDLNVRVLFLMHHAAGIEYPAALLTYRHILRHIATRDARELSDLGIAAARKSPLELFAEKRDEARSRSRRRVPSD
jgi:predicted transcriptional regulator